MPSEESMKKAQDFLDEIGGLDRDLVAIINGQYVNIGRRVLDAYATALDAAKAERTAVCADEIRDLSHAYEINTPQWNVLRIAETHIRSLTKGPSQ